MFFNDQLIKDVLFAFIGTTGKEADSEVINKCFEKAFADNNVFVDISLLKKTWEKTKKNIIENVLKGQQISLSLRDSIYASCKKNIANSIDRFFENDGTGDVFLYLKEKNIRICIGTDPERDVFNTFCRHLNGTIPVLTI